VVLHAKLTWTLSLRELSLPLWRCCCAHCLKSSIVTLFSESIWHHITRRHWRVCTAADINQARSEYKHSLTFHVRHYVVIAMKPVHQLQIHPIVHNQRAPPTIPPSYIRVCAVVCECGEEWTDRQTHRRPWPIYTSPQLCLAWNVITHTQQQNPQSGQETKVSGLV